MEEKKEFVTIRIEADVHQQIKVAAALRRVSIHKLVDMAIQAFLLQKENPDRDATGRGSK